MRAFLLAVPLLLLAGPQAGATTVEVDCGMLPFRVSALPGLPSEGFRCYRQNPAAEGLLTRLVALQRSGSFLLQATLTTTGQGNRLHRPAVEDLRESLERQDSWYRRADWSSQQDLPEGSYITAHRSGRSCFVFDALAARALALHVVVYCEAAEAPLSEGRVRAVLSAVAFPET